VAGTESKMPMPAVYNDIDMKFNTAAGFPFEHHAGMFQFKTKGNFEIENRRPDR
jgi:hypothetical protein